MGVNGEALQLHSVYHFLLQVTRKFVSGTSSHARCVWTCNEIEGSYGKSLSPLIVLSYAASLTTSEIIISSPCTSCIFSLQYITMLTIVHTLYTVVCKQYWSYCKHLHMYKCVYIYTCTVITTKNQSDGSCVLWHGTSEQSSKIFLRKNRISLNCKVFSLESLHVICN